MRYFVISDIHANLEALETVLALSRDVVFDRMLLLGDLVGYGADPNAVVERVRAIEPFAVIRGNHDKVGSGVERADGFNAVARSAIRWTYDTLTPENREWLAALPAGPVVIDDLIEICHGTPFDEDAYVFDDLDALRAMNAADRRLCLFGHTHVQVGYRLWKEELSIVTPDDPQSSVVKLAEGQYLLNPGSVGQPRDGDPRAAYAIIDTDTMELDLLRVEYPVERAQARIMEEGLPEVLAQRLALGR
jgi:diadenosine tetraphosphatase ApaH/serine/threonine PP2A family protein phosphatase